MEANRTPGQNAYQRIKRAAMCGTGLHLSAEEAWTLYWADTAIKTVADDSDGWVGQNPATCGDYGVQRRAAIAKAAGS